LSSSLRIAGIGAVGEPLRFLAVGGVTLDLGQIRQAVAIGERSLRQNERRGTVGIC